MRTRPNKLTLLTRTAALLVVVGGLATAALAGWRDRWTGDSRYCKRTVVVPYALPNNGYHTTRWRRFPEPVASPFATPPLPSDAYAPAAVGHAPPGHFSQGHVPQGQVPVGQGPVESAPTAPGATPILPAAPLSNRVSPTPTSPGPTLPPAPATPPAGPVEEAAPRYETREWRLGAPRPTIPRFSQAESGTRRSSYETREWTLGDRPAIDDERPVNAVLLTPADGAPRPLPLPLPLPGIGQVQP